MKTIKVSEATNLQLDWLVAKCEGVNITFGEHGPSGQWEMYSTDWTHGGPILTKARISRTIDHSGLWIAYWTDGYGDGDDANKWMQCDHSELVAGLRCLVTSKLGDEVEVPEELT